MDRVWHGHSTLALAAKLGLRCTIYREAKEHLAALVIKRGGDPEKALTLLRPLGHLAEMIGSEVYGAFEAEAQVRLGARDPEDRPILASAHATSGTKNVAGMRLDHLPHSLPQNGAHQNIGVLLGLYLASA